MKKFLAVVIFILGIAIIALYMKAGRNGTGKEITVKDITVKDIAVKDTTIKDISVKEIDSFEEVREKISEVEDKFQTSISEETKDEITNTVIKLENMGFSSDTIISKAGGLYEKYGTDFVNHLEEAFTEAAVEAAEDAAKGVIQSVKDTVKETIDKVKED